MTKTHFHPFWCVLGARIVVVIGLLCGVLPTSAFEYPDGFSEEVIWDNLEAPTALRFVPDGRVLVAEQSGRILMYDSLSDSTPTLLRGAEAPYAHGDLLGLTLDPEFASGRPYLYLFYLAPPAQDPSSSKVPCSQRTNEPVDVAPLRDDPACLRSGRLIRVELSLATNSAVGEQRLLLAPSWCPSQENKPDADLLFDASTRSLYLTLDGASHRVAVPLEGSASHPPCGQRVESIVDGGLLRVDPDSGEWIESLALQPSRIPSSSGAEGHRSFGIAARTSPQELWAVDIAEGGDSRLQSKPSGAQFFSFHEDRAFSFHEARATLGDGDRANERGDNSLHSSGLPDQIQSRAESSTFGIDSTGELACLDDRAGTVSALQFYEDTRYPGRYRGALVVADSSRECIYVLPQNGAGELDVAQRSVLAEGDADTVDLQVGPDGLLYYVDRRGGRIVRVNFLGNTTPTAVIDPSATSGDIPLSLTLDGSNSFDPDPGDSLSYSWDLNDDGNFDNHFTDSWSGVIPNVGVYTSRLRVEDNSGDFDIAAVEIVAGNNPPIASIDSPNPAPQWKVGDSITVTGSGTDSEDGSIPAASMSWAAEIVHCPTAQCHTHPITSASGVNQLQFIAPDHPFDSYIQVLFTVTDDGIPGEGGLGELSHTATLDLLPLTTTISVDTLPSGLQVDFGGELLVTPFVKSVIQGSSTLVTPVSPQVFNSATYNFYGWVDDPAAPVGRTILAIQQPATFLAVFETGGCAAEDLVCDGLDDDCDGPADEDFVSYQVSCGVGACESVGTVSCVGGAIVHDCVPGTPAPDDVTCDNVDDDCNGLVDDGFVEQATQCGVGLCTGNSGLLTCLDGVENDSCDPLLGAAPDTNCDNVDDDCDGTPDDDFPPTPTDCGGLGECAVRGGVEICESGVVGDTCDPFLGATLDDNNCNGLDDDCDGQTDEDYLDGPNSCGEGECAGNVGTQQCLLDDVVLYGGNRDSVLQQINVTASTDQNEGTLLFGTQAIEQDPETGFIYYFDRQNNADEFAYYDPATQLNTLVRTYVPVPNVYPKRLAFDAYGTLYMMDNVEKLYTVDKTNGDTTLLGTVAGLPEEGFGATGDFAFAPDGTLYIATYRSIYTLAIDTLTPTLVWDEILTEPEGFSYVFTGIAFCNGAAYVSDGQEDTGLSAVYELDLSTGNLTELFLLDVLVNDLTTCPANGRRGVTEIDTCDPFAGAQPDLTCNGLDEDCDGFPDDEALAPGNALMIEVDLNEIRWTAEFDAQQYDVLRGGLATLLGSAGDFTLATESCVVDDEVGLSTPHVLEPAPGQAFWYLVQPSNCAGSGSWESTGAAQLGSRSSEIAASASACP